MDQQRFNSGRTSNGPHVPVKEIRGSFVSDSRKARCSPTVGYPLAPADSKMDTLGFRCCRSTRLPRHSQQYKISSMHVQAICVLTLQGVSINMNIPIKRVPSRPKCRLEAAFQLCKTAGKHLCTETEWSDACSGLNRRRWSYGNTYDAQKCHHASQQYEGGARPSGHFSECHTPEGVSDMTGNLWEWNDSGILRGGNWNFSEGLGQCNSIARPAPHIHNDEIGLRCCATIKEAQALLALSENPP